LSVGGFVSDRDNGVPFPPGAGGRCLSRPENPPCAARCNSNRLAGKYHALTELLTAAVKFESPAGGTVNDDVADLP